MNCSDDNFQVIHFSLFLSFTFNSTSISTCDLSAESDEFYDTASDINRDSPPIIGKYPKDCESAYSSLTLEDIFSKEDNFKIIVKNQFQMDPESVDNFATIFIKRGMKCKNSGFVNLVDVIQDSLKEDDELFLKFVDTLDRKFLEFTQNLDENVPNVKSLRLILMIGEFYNMGYMKSPTFISCLEKLLNDIGGQHQITLFHQLIKISMDKIIQNGLGNVVKTFLDVLGKRLPSVVDSNDRNLIAWELFVTLKILHYRHQKFQLQCPVTNFKMFLSKMNEETFVDRLKEVKEFFYKKVQLAEVVEYFLLTSIASYKSKVYVKIAHELQEVSAIDDVSFNFKNHMEFKLQDVIKNFLVEINNDFNMIELFKITSFVGDLFIGNVTSINLVLYVLEMLLEKEIESRKIVDCIKVLMQKVGWKIDMDSNEFDKIFLFFKQVIKYEQGYRKMVYKELVDLREKGWKRTESEKNMETIEELFGKLTNSNFIEISLMIYGFLTKSAVLIEMFMKFLWKMILNNHDSTLLYTKLTCAICTYNEAFKKYLINFMRKRNEAFRRICMEPKISEDTRKKLSAVTNFMGYVFVFDDCEEDDVISWLLPELTRHLNMEQHDAICYIVETKIKETQNSQLLQAFVTLIEYHSQKNLFAVIENVKNDLNELKFSLVEKRN